MTWALRCPVPTPTDRLLPAFSGGSGHLKGPRTTHRSRSRPRHCQTARSGLYSATGSISGVARHVPACGNEKTRSWRFGLLSVRPVSRSPSRGIRGAVAALLFSIFKNLVRGALLAPIRIEPGVLLAPIEIDRVFCWHPLKRVLCWHLFLRLGRLPFSRDPFQRSPKLRVRYPGSSFPQVAVFLGVGSADVHLQVEMFDVDNGPVLLPRE